MKVEFVHPSHLEDPAKAQLSSRVVPVVRVEELRNLVRLWRAQQSPHESISFQMAMRQLELAIKGSLPEGV